MTEAGPKKRHEKRLRLLSAPALAIFGIVAVLLITACVANQSAIGRVMMAMNDDSKNLPAEARAELERFQQVYDTYVDDASDRERLDYFNFAFRRVRASYVYDIEDKILIDAAIKGVEEAKAAPGTMDSEMLVEDALHSMLKALDPHSSYLNAAEFRDSFANTKGEFGGLGIQVTMENELVKVIAPIEDTPAERAGMKSGDYITSVDGVEIKGKSLRDAVGLMRGKAGDPVLLGVRRDGAPDFEMRLVRAIIEVKSVRHRVEGDIGYVRITRFNEKTKDGLQQAVTEIRDQLGPRLRGLVVDLRNNPGGLLAQSVIAADAFLERGKIVSIKGRDGRDERSYYADPGDSARGLPIVVLVNRGSASASEIVASALQNHGRAVVMGTRTFGKGSVQTIMPLPLEGALRLTTALYYSPSGLAIQAFGVIPDIDLVSKDDPVAEDDGTREADLPGAIPVQAEQVVRKHPKITADACPAVGDTKDHVLGCALEYLRAASEQAFFNKFKPAGQG